MKGRKREEEERRKRERKGERKKRWDVGGDAGKGERKSVF